MESEAETPDGMLDSSTRPNGLAKVIHDHPFLIGGLICFVAGILDNVFLKWASQTNWSGIAVQATFILFVVQTFVLSAFVGRQLRRTNGVNAGWVFFFFWSLAFINLILSVVLLDSNWEKAMQLSLAFAFFAAQIGLVIVWGVLGAVDWRLRLPVFLASLIFVCYPLTMMQTYAARGWFSVLACYFAAVLLTCCVLRFRRFEITTIVLEEAVEEEVAPTDPVGQFSLANLFVWTTIVAVLFGFGRLVPWGYLWDSLWVDQFLFAVLSGLLMTVITVATCWSALGKKRSIVVRLVVLLLLLGAVAFGLYQAEQVRGAGPWATSFVGGWNLRLANPADRKTIFGIWLSWTTLNGLFLFGLLQVMGAAGCTLVRMPKKV